MQRAEGRVNCMRKLMMIVLVVVATLAMVLPSQAVLPGFIKFRDGYFYDNVSGATFVPHGIAYQTWNRPLGVWQTKAQIDYDLDEMKKMGANSIRVDFVWQHVEEDGDNQWKWDNYDYLVAAAEKRDMRIFALIGYQWPPNWFPDEWYTKHPPATDSSGIYHTNRWQSDIINYEHPEARAQYAEWFQNVCGRYKNSKAIAGWIIGNESGYLGLWSGLLDGYDPESEAAFRSWAQAKYVQLTNLNARWGTAITNFNDIKFVEQYREYGTEGAIWSDMVQWREDSIGTFTAIGAKAAKGADTNHLISYSTVGMQWGEEDWRYHAEDRGKITAACEATNAPVDFFAVNNYPWSILGHESQNGQWGISFTKFATRTAGKPAGVPVLYSETGFTSSETMWPGMDEYRQGPLVRNALWESLAAGAVGTHIFAWHDRPYITDREKGFGILTAERGIKPAFWDSQSAFSLMEQAKIAELLRGSQDPKPDIGFLWTAANDSQYNRYECEMQQISGALERRGFEPNFVNLNDLANGTYTNFKVLVLPRNMRVDTVVPNSTNKTVLQFLRENVLAKGIHILATADLPGMQDENGRTMANFTNEMALLFGIDAADVGGYEVPPRQGTFVEANMKRITVSFTNATGALTNGYRCTPKVWKYNDEIKVNSGTVWATMDSGRNKGFEDTNTFAKEWGSWSNVVIQRDWGWQYSGRNMCQLWGDSGIFQWWDIVPFGHYTHSMWLRSNSSDPLRNGSVAYLAIEWRGKDGRYLGVSESAQLATNSLGAGGGTVDAPNFVKNPGFETNGANWSYTGQLNIENGFAAYAAETGSYGAWMTNNAGEFYIYQQIPVATWAPSYGTTLVYRVRARKAGNVPGAIKLELYHPWVTVTNIDITSALTTNWQTFSLYYKPTAGADQVLELRLRNATGGSNNGQVFYDNVYCGVTNTTTTSSDAWVKYSVDDVAPSNAWSMTRLVRVIGTNLLSNPQLTGTGLAPNGWQNWNDGSHDPCTSVFAGTAGNSWTFWWDGGIYQDVTSGFAAGETIKFGGYFYTPENDRLRGGTKYGLMLLEFYNSTNGLISTVSASPTISAASTNDVWLPVDAVTTVPAGTTKIRYMVRCNDYASGDGRFMVDDVYLRNGTRGSGSVFIDNVQENPALVVKNHGTAKAAIFLFSAGDISTDGDGNGEMDVLPWQWRYDYVGTVVKDYFGVQPLLQFTGANAHLGIAEYRTCTNGSTLWQVKNYMYDRFSSNPPGGPDLTFTLQSSLFNGKTVRAFESGRIVETNSDGIISLTLKPDGQEILLAYAATTNQKEIIQIANAPSVVHPMGDKAYSVIVKYDCQNTTGLVVKVAFKEQLNNGDTLTNEIYAALTNVAVGAGQQEFFLWIPPYKQNDTDYKSTPDGGKYEFAAWLEKAGGVHAADAVPVPTALEWGVRPTSATPTNMTLGSSYALPIEWEDLYEPLSWQLTPGARNDQFPSRVGVFRSSKTEAQYAGQFTRANAVCDWLESMGYVAGNPLDLSFDNIVVSNGTLFTDNFEDGNYTGWTRDAGCANWAVQTLGASQGQAIRYDRYTTYSLDTTTKRLSYKITADAGKTIDRVYLYACRLGTCPTYSLSLYKDLDGVPTGSALFTQTFTAPTTTYTWVNVDVPNTAWSAGSTYHLVMGYVSGTANASNCFRAQFVGMNTTGRRVLYSTTSGTTWTTNYVYEPSFRVQYTDGSSFAQPYISYSAAGVLNNARYGQQFRLTEAAYVTNASIVLYKQTNVNGDVSLQIRRWSDKVVLATSTVSRTSILTTNNWVNFQFSSPVLLGAATQYFLEVVNRGTTGYFYTVRENSAGGYGAYTWDQTSNATVYSSNTGVTWSAQTDYDIGYVLSGYTKNQALRTWRIGNSDNIMKYTTTYTNVTLSADVRYNKQDSYFDDIELYVHYKDRANYYRVAIENYYAFWRLKYVVVQNTNIISQGWLFDFAKTNRPVENTWYNLKVVVQGSTNQVYFNNMLAGTFWATNVPSGKVAVGTRALQLGNWEPQKGYYFIDDDEWSFWAPEGQAQVSGHPLNLDYGYLRLFFNTLVLPSTYVMSDIEVSNVITWVKGGLNSIIATDGGIAMKNETGAYDLGRIESILGVGTALQTFGSVSGIQVQPDDHYVTLDYAPGAILPATGTANAYQSTTVGTDLGLLYNATSSAPAMVANVLWDNPLVPVKVFTFNHAVDTQGQLTGQMKTIAQRAFEWARGNAFKCKVELKYTGSVTNPYDDYAVWSSNFWILTSSGSNSVNFTLPTDGILTGSNLVWSYTIYPWDSTNYWIQNQGFYSSELDGKSAKIAGRGIQMSGAPEAIFAGRNWETWTAFNTEGTQTVMTIGIKDTGVLTFEDNFNDGNYTGWTVDANTNITWSVVAGSLRGAVASTGGYANIHVDSVAIDSTNLTFEYYVRFMNGADDGGVYYRGYRLYVNPRQCGWGDLNPIYYTNTGISTGWNHVVVQVRDGAPRMRSDLFVNGKTVFLDEPIEVPSLMTNGIGFVSPDYPGYVEWDNVRIADEHYEFVTTNVTGQGGPMSMMIAVPDYDPARWEHAGTSLGAGYEWYSYLSGQGVHSYRPTAVYFAPRFIVEDTNFPTLMNPGTTVNIPVEWEHLPSVPMKLQIQLKDGWAGKTWLTNTFDVATVSGSAYFQVAIPENMPPGGGYCWFAMIYPPAAADPMLERLGSDDTFRYGRDGMPVEPETLVSITPVVGPDYRVYRDAGIPMATDIATWQGGAATFNGQHVTNNAPEGTQTFLVDAASWAGWGVISTSAVNMAEYQNGFVTFWLRSTLVIKMDIEDWNGIKATKYIPSTSNLWKQIYVPVSEISLAGVSLTQIKGLIEVTAEAATRFEVDDVRWTKGIYGVYNDGGFVTNTTLITQGGGVSYFDANFLTGAPPEGVKCFMATGSSWLGWSTRQTSGTLDMTRYSNGYLSAWIRSGSALTLKIEGPAGTTRSVTTPSTTGMWKRVIVPMSSFAGVNFSQIYSTFAVTSAVAGTFFVDDVQWIRGTNAVPSDTRMTLYSDLGIPAGTDVQTWWSEWWLVYVSPADGWVSQWRNGGFETVGAGVPSWTTVARGAGATAYVTTAAAYQGTYGLRVQTGSASTDRTAMVYQEFTSGEGDMFWAEAMIRQPAGQAWVAGTTARVEVEFLNTWGQTLTNFVALTGTVTTAGQTWTRCNNLTGPKDSNTTAPRDTAYARIKLIINKPAAAGASVVDFDNSYFCLRSSFNGNYALDPLTPEGTKCFKTFSAGWAGWGVVSTNSTVDISAYTNGYLKFWFKAPQVTLSDLIFNWYYGIWSVGYDVQLQSVYNGKTNTVSYSGVQGLTTTNGLQWYQVSIPVNAFTSQGLDAQHVRCPFMITAAMTTAWYVDYIRFDMAP